MGNDSFGGGFSQNCPPPPPPLGRKGCHPSVSHIYPPPPWRLLCPPPIAPIRARPALPPSPPKEGGRKEKTFAPNLRGGGGEGGGNFCHNTSSNKSNFFSSFLFLLPLPPFDISFFRECTIRRRLRKKERRRIQMDTDGATEGGGDREKERKSPRTYLVAVLLYYCSTRPWCSIYIVERKDALISLLTPLT